MEMLRHATAASVAAFTLCVVAGSGSATGQPPEVGPFASIRQLAEAGSIGEQQVLGRSYRRGIVVGGRVVLPRDEALAVFWFHQTAAQGDAMSQFFLALAYEEGQDVAQDNMEAYKWLSLASSRMTPGEFRERIMRQQDGLEALLGPEQVAEAQRRAQKWDEEPSR